MRSSNLSRAPLPPLGLLALAVLGMAAVAAMLVAVGPAKALIAFVGIFMVFMMVQWPVIVVIMVVFTGTCLQVLGSSTVIGLPLSIGKISGMLGMTIWFVIFMRDRIGWTYTPQLKALACYVGAMLATALLVHPAMPSVENGFIRFLQSFVVFWLIANLAGTSRTALLISLASLTAAVVGSGVIGAVEFFLPSFGLEHEEVSKTEGLIGARLDRDSLDGVILRRITGGMGDSNWLAATVAAVLPLNLYWLWRARGNWERLLVLGIAGIQALALLMSYARLGFMGLAVAILYLVVRRIISPRLLAWGAAAVLVMGLIWLPPGLVDRFFSTKYLEEGSTPIRMDLMNTGIGLILERPLFGSGFGQFGIEFVERVKTTLSSQVSPWAFETVREVEEGTDFAHNIGVHNMYLEVMVEYGILGLAAFVGFLALIVADLRCCERWGTKDDRMLAICLAAGVLGLFVSSIFIHAKYLKILWIMAGLAAAHRRVVLTEHAAAEREKKASVLF